jgi:type I restriction enzyme R subunit
LGGGDLELDEQNVWRAYGKKVDSLLAFLRYRFELNELPDYQEIVQREFDHYIAAQQFTGDQVRFLRAVQSVLLRKRRLRLADLYASPLTRFGQEAVQRFFTEAQTTAMITFLDSLAVAE